jgi:hypothetical protein
VFTVTFVSVVFHKKCCIIAFLYHQFQSLIIHNMHDTKLESRFVKSIVSKHGVLMVYNEEYHNIGFCFQFHLSAFVILAIIGLYFLVEQCVLCGEKFSNTWLLTE